MKSVVHTAPTFLFAGCFAVGLIGTVELAGFGGLAGFSGLAGLGGGAIAPSTNSFTPFNPSEAESLAQPSSGTPSSSVYIAPIVGQPLRTEGGGTR